MLLLQVLVPIAIPEIVVVLSAWETEGDRDVSRKGAIVKRTKSAPWIIDTVSS